MAWRRFKNHKEESREVKKFMVSEGYQDVKVGHGRGTAWGWLEVSISIPRPTDCYCSGYTAEGADWTQVRKNDRGISCGHCDREYFQVYNETCKKLMEFTGRKGEYNGDITVDVNWQTPTPELLQVRPVVEVVPNPQPEPEAVFDMDWFAGV